MFVCALCVCLVTLLGQETSSKDTAKDDVNGFTFLTYNPSQKGPVNESNSEQMTNHTLNANTTQEGILETTVAPNLAENDRKQNAT